MFLFKKKNQEKYKKVNTEIKLVNRQDYIQPKKIFNNELHNCLLDS